MKEREIERHIRLLQKYMRTTTTKLLHLNLILKNMGCKSIDYPFLKYDIAKFIKEFVQFLDYLTEDPSEMSELKKQLGNPQERR